MRNRTLQIFVAMVMLAWTSTVHAGECKKFIELHSIDHIAEDTGWTKSYIISNHRLNLWQSTIEKGKGRVVGKLLPGSRALLLKTEGEDSLVKSPFDNSTGWISNIQVSHTLWQDDQEFTPCTP